MDSPNQLETFHQPKEDDMAENLTIRCRDDGPYVIQGAITVVDASGKPFTIPAGKDVVALCRCGASKNRPFCDGTHKSAGFKAAERAPDQP